MTRVIAIRHGETEWNRHERMQGWAPVPLNETGRKQAEATGQWIANEYQIDRVLTSDLLRTRETTELLLDSIGDRPVDFETALRERALGVYQGLTYTDIETRFPKFALSESGYRATEAVPEGGESLRTVEERVVGRFEEVPKGNDETVLLVTHGGPLSILVGHAKRQTLTESLSSHSPTNCAITEFEIDHDETAIVRENASAPDRR